MGNMRLLIITQKVDINDDILGFFHHWIEKLAEKFESIIVICLQKGEYNLPKNVEILSLGKEKNRSKIKYLWNFYKYIFLYRKNYDSVFVHMNQKYVILGGIFWKLFGKKVSMWRNHLKGNFFTRITVLMSDVVFCTSQFAFVSKYKKTKIMPVGIDIEKFKPQISNLKSPNSILYLGRISPIKKVDILIEALRILRDKNINFRAKIIGDATEKDKKYYKNLKQYVDIERGVPNYRTPEIYNQYEIFVNMTNSGSMDKTIFEAMACGCLVLLSNKSLLGQIDERLFFEENNADDLAIKLEKILSLSDSEKQSIIKTSKDFVIQKHSLNLLIKKLLEEFK